jgi:hypothetical protein
VSVLKEPKRCELQTDWIGRYSHCLVRTGPAVVSSHSFCLEVGWFGRRRAARRDPAACVRLDGQVNCRDVGAVLLSSILNGAQQSRKVWWLKFFNSVEATRTGAEVPVRRKERC